MKTLPTSWQIYFRCRESRGIRERLFEDIWYSFQRPLTFFIRSFAENEAEDIFQEVMSKVFQNIEKFNPLYSFKTWTYSIARNHCLNHIARRELPTTSASPETESAFPAPAEESPEARLIRKEFHMAIHRILSTFSDDNRRIAFLRFYEGMKHREIARVMDIPTGTVKSRLHASRRLLINALEAEDGR